MTYVALLRGINVGGNRTVDMGQLKATFESVGMLDVRTYINSGNVVFRAEPDGSDDLVRVLEAAIEATFGFHVMVILRAADRIRAVVEALPDAWVNGPEAKCDVMFLGDAFDHADVIDELTIRPGLDEVRYVAGAILWRVDRADAARSGMQKLIGTDLYANMTIRNCNTVRRLEALMR